MMKAKITPLHALNPQPPAHLSAASKKWWHSVVSEFVMSDTDMRVLQAACESLDAAEAARKVLVKQGTTYTDDKGIIRANPNVQIAKDNRALALRLISSLRLDAPPARPQGRPPGGHQIMPERK